MKAHLSLTEIQASHLASSREFESAVSARSLVSTFVWAADHAFLDETFASVRKLRLLVRSFASFGASARWFEFMRDKLKFSHATHQRYLFESVHRPFFDHRLTPEQRCALLASHFLEQARSLPENMHHALLAGETISLASWLGKNDQTFQLCLTSEDRFKREGILSLSLWMNQRRLLTTSFSIARSLDSASVLVGGIQANAEVSREEIKRATIGLYGMQPRLFLLEMLREVAVIFEVDEIECVASDHHIHRAARYQHRKKRMLDYDELWLTAGAQRAVCGNFHLPLQRTQIAIEDRPANKRKMYRQREELLSSLRATLREVLQVDGESAWQLAA